MVKQSFVANVVALSEAMAMTDASKRRGEAVEDSPSSQEFIPVEKVRAQAKPIVPKAKSISKGSTDGYSGEGTSDGIPIPSGVTAVDWGKTLCQLPRVATSAKWKNKSYDELIDLSKEDQELTKYLSFLYQKFLEQYVDGSGKTQAPDFAGYMAFVGFEPNAKSKDSGFNRVLKK